MIRLKKLGKDEEHLAHQCSAAKCTNEVAVIDGTRKLAPCDVYLCEKHWQAKCNAEDTKERRLHQPKPKRPGVWAFQITDDGLELVE